MKKFYLILLLVCFGNFLYAQNRVIKGIVKSEADKEPLIGVSVKVKNTTQGTVTGIDGDFSIDVPVDAVLEFSYVGFKTTEISVSGKNSLDVLLQEDSHLLTEVVAVGYRTERKADLTGAVSVVDVADMMSAAENNPMKALQGRIAGMQVTTDGSPSGAATIRIRGIGTLNNNDPLYIIDGVPSTAGMHELNSNDIESIQVLRDASAASIYGSRAANGVIIVTTKKGKSGSLKVNFDAYATASFYANRMKMLNSKEYAEVIWKANVNDGLNPNNNTLGIVFQDELGTQGNRILKNVYVPEFLDSDKTLRTSDTDWFDEVTRTGFAQSYNLSVSNGSDKGSYFLSLGYYDNNGIVKKTDFSRYSARINSDYKLFDGLITIGENFTLSRTSEVAQPHNILEQALRAIPLIPVHTDDGKGWGGPIGGMPDRHNPARLVDDNRDNRYRYWRLFGNAFVNVQPVKGLNVRSSFGIDYGNFYKRSLTYSYKTGYLESDKTSVLMEQAHWTKWTWSNTATYDFMIGKNRFETLLGMEMFKQEDINFSSQRDGFALEDPNFMWPDQGSGNSLVTGGSTGYNLMSYFGKVSYAYDDKYLASATLRHDGSSRFGKNNRWGTFPAFNLGWRITQEEFMKPLDHIFSDLKLRFGWGQTGNQEMGNYATYTIYVTDYGTGNPTWGRLTGTAYDLAGKGSGILSSGFRRNQRENPNLKWETTTQTNIGLDFGLLDQSLYGSVEYYIKDTKDILFMAKSPGILGGGSDKYFNGAKMQNKGVEISAGYRDKTPFGLSYDITANWSKNNNKVVYIPDAVLVQYGGNGTWDNILNRPYGSFYGYVADGIFKTQEQLDRHAKQDGKGLGRLRYRDINNDGIIDEKDRTWLGNPFPDFEYGLNINLAYKDFDLVMFFQGVHNIDVYNLLKVETDFWSASDPGSNKGHRLLGAWDPVTNPGSDIPALSTTDSNNESRFSSYMIENGSYLKFRNVQLGYTLPKTTTAKIGLDRLRFYISGQNLFTIKSNSFTGFDPENVNYGYPIPMTFTFGLNASF